MNEDIIFGLWSQGDSSGFHSPIDNRKAKNIIKTAYKQGIRVFDTAFSYKQSNSLLYSALKEIGVKTEDVGITLKIMPYPSFLKKVESSLKALATEHVTTVLLHWPAKEELLFPALKELEKIKDKGICKEIGVSNFPLPLLKKISSDFNIFIHQRPVSAIWKKDLEKEFLKIQGYGAIGFGTLAGMDIPKDNRRNLYIYKEAKTDFQNLIAAIREIAAKNSTSMAETALSYARSLSSGTTIIGASEENQLSILQHPPFLSEEDKKRLDALSDKLLRFQMNDNIFGHDWRGDGHTD